MRTWLLFAAGVVAVGATVGVGQVLTENSYDANGTLVGAAGCDWDGGWPVISADGLRS